MPKQIIVVMQQSYPFGQCQQCTNESTRVLVRKIYQANIQERNKLLQKVNILRKLKNEHMIKIESVLEEQQSIHFLFQYIPIKLQTWISNINDQFIENFRDQLIKFSSFLANHYIRIDFQLKNIGMDQNYGAKYFLDLNFEMDSSINREKLKSNYIRQITNLFKPYIMNASSTPIYPIDSQRQRQRSSNDFKSNKQPNKNTQDTRKVHDTSISPPTNKPNNSNSNNKKNQKALAQYYQEVNMSVDSENQKILQEFMDVLDNEQEEESKHQHQHSHQQTPSKNQPQTNSPQPNQFQKQGSQQTSPLQQQQQQQQQKNTYQQQQSNNYQQQQTQQTNHYNQQQANSYQQNSYQHNNYPSSARQIPQNQTQQNQYPQFHTQNNFNAPSSQTLPVKTANSQMADKNRQLKQSLQAQKFRQSADLQNRVKSAIQKSMNVIKKFKAIKDDSLV